MGKQMTLWIFFSHHGYQQANTCGLIDCYIGGNANDLNPTDA